MPAYKIQIRNTTSRHSVRLSRLKNVTLPLILKALGLRRAALSVLLVGDKRIQTLNRRYLRHDRPTDVIAFSQLEGTGIRARLEGTPFLGDIVVSLDTTARQARRFGNRFDYELHFYLCHGILHLLGYSDKTRQGAAKMDKIQKKVMKTTGIKQ